LPLALVPAPGSEAQQGQNAALAAATMVLSVKPPLTRREQMLFYWFHSPKPSILGVPLACVPPEQADLVQSVYSEIASVDRDIESIRGRIATILTLNGMLVDDAREQARSSRKQQRVWKRRAADVPTLERMSRRVALPLDNDVAMYDDLLGS
jgi:hypothetical protein